MKKILAMFAVLTMGISTTATVIACGTTISPPTKLIDPQFSESIDSNNIDFDSKDETKITNQITDAFENNNTTIQLDELTLTVKVNAEFDGALLIVQVKAKSKVYNQTKQIYQIGKPTIIAPEEKADLSALINYNFKEFEHDSEKADLINHFKELNPDLNYAEFELSAKIKNEFSGAIKVSVNAGSDVYKQFNHEYLVIIKAPKLIDLELTTTFFEPFENNVTTGDLIKAFISANPVLNGNNEVQITATINEATNKGTIFAKVVLGSKKYYQKNWTITVDIKEKPIDWTPIEPGKPVLKSLADELIQTSFNPFEYGTSANDLKVKMQDANPVLKDNSDVVVTARIDELNLTGMISLEVIADSKVYKQFKHDYPVTIKPKPADAKANFVLLQEDFAPFKTGITTDEIKSIFMSANLITEDDLSNASKGMTIDVEINPSDESKGWIKLTIKDSQTYNNFTQKIAISIAQPEEKKFINNLQWNFYANPVDVDVFLADKIGFQTTIERMIKTSVDSRVSRSDYEIVGFNGDHKAILATGGLTVIAKETSQIIQGSFEVKFFKDLNKLTKTWNTFGNVDDSDQTKIDLLKLINEYIVPKRNEDYILDEQRDNSWSITATPPTSRIKLNFIFYTYKNSLSSMNESFTNVKVNDNFDELKVNIGNTIRNTFDLNVKDDDYVISGDTSIGDGIIKVEATPTSQRLIHGFEINVSKISINETEISDLKVLTTHSEVSNHVLNTLEETNPNLKGLLSSSNDFQVSSVNKNRFLVKAKPNSNYLTGEFVIDLTKFELSEINSYFDNNSLNKSSTANEIQTEIEASLNKLFFINGEQRLTADQAGTIDLQQKKDNNQLFVGNWQATAIESDYLQGSYDILLGKVDLATLVNVAGLTVGSKEYSEVLDDVQNQINNNFASANIELDVDYKIATDTTNKMKQAGDITITATEESKLVTGSAKISVGLAWINNVRLFEDLDLKFVPLNNLAVTKIDETIIDKVNTIFKINEPYLDQNKNNLPIKITEDDYDIFDDKGNRISKNLVTKKTTINKAGLYTVMANNKSNKIIGKFNFNVGPIDLAELSRANPISIQVEDNADTAINQALEMIQNLVRGLKIVEGVDYRIVDNTITNGAVKEVGKDFGNALSSGDIVIEGIPKYQNPSDITSPYIGNLIGSFVIIVNKKSINGLVIEPQFSNQGLNAIKSTVLAKIQTLFTLQEIKVTENDFKILDSTLKEVTTNNLSAGRYRVVGADGVASSKLITGEFSFEVKENEISFFADEIPFKDQSNFANMSSQQIVETINSELEKFMNGQKLVRGKDFEIYREDGITINNNLNDGTTIWVKALNSGYIKGSFKFKAGKFSLSEADLAKDLIVYANESNPDRLKVEINQKIYDLNKNQVSYGVDYTMTDWPTAFSQGKITVSALETSKILSGSFEIEILPVSLSQVDFTGKYNFNDKMYENNPKGYERDFSWKQTTKTIKHQNLEIDIATQINNLFANSWVKQNDPTFSLKQDINYEIEGLDNFYLQNAGPGGIRVKAKLNSNWITDSFGINVSPTTKIEGTDVFAIYLASGAGYTLTSKRSSWGHKTEQGDWLQTNLEGTQANYISSNQILASSDIFLATIRGIYYTSKLIEGTDKLKLKTNDILAINNEIIVTTKGTWYLPTIKDNRSLSDYLSIEPVKIAGLDELTRQDFLGVSKNLIVTTSGVWFKTVKVIDQQLPTVTWTKLANNNNFDNLTRQDVLAVNDNFLVTTNGVWSKTNDIVNDLTPILTAKLKPSDLLKLTVDSIQLENHGIINRDGTIVGGSNQTNTIIAQTDNYLVTKTEIFWKGQKIGNYETSDNFVIANNDWLIINRKVYYHGKLSRRSNNNMTGDWAKYNFGNITSDRISGINESFLVLKNRVQYKDFDAYRGNLEKANNATDMHADDRNHRVLGMGKNHLFIKDRYFYWVVDQEMIWNPNWKSDGGFLKADRNNWWIPGYDPDRFGGGYWQIDNTTRTMTDHYLIMYQGYYSYFFAGERATMTGLTLPKFSNSFGFTITGRLLITGGEVWFNGVRYNQPGANQINPSDIIGVTDDRLITLKGILYIVGNEKNYFEPYSE